jgi:hypothetical protein
VPQTAPGGQQGHLRSTNYANPSSTGLRWADNEQGRRDAASAMLPQDAKCHLLILYAFTDFL